MAKPRAIWKGAITFGLVLVPVALYPASEEIEIDFDLLDKRTMDPVGYQRVNKRTGEKIEKENVVRGIKHQDDEYVILSDDEIKAAYPKTTQTIAIENFVSAQEIPFEFLERPYYLEPQKKAERVYSLLLEAMAKEKVVGIARVVIHTKEHLAALIPKGAVLMLNTLRWASEVRSSSGLEVPSSGESAAKLKESELKMARQLIQQSIADWDPGEYKEQFTGAVGVLVARRVKAGKTSVVEPIEDAENAGESNVVDLTELLKQSLGARKAKAESKRTRSRS